MIIKNELLSKIIKLSIPVMLGQIMFSLLNFADRYFIAKIGVPQAAGSALSGGLNWTLITFTTFVTGGTVALIARRAGEKDKAGIINTAHRSIFMSIIFGIIITTFAYFSSEILLGFYKAEPIVEKISISYFKIAVLAFPFMFAGSTMGSVFSALGDTKTSMRAFSLMCLINLILDPIFIFGLGPISAFGVQGAAVATVISSAIAFFILLYNLYKFDKKIIWGIFKIRADFSVSKSILKIGVWSGLNGFSRPLSAIFLQKAITHYGKEAIAGFSFGIQWISLFFIFMEGLRVAVSTIVGQFLGKKESENAVKAVNVSIKFAYLIVLFIMGFSYFFAENAIKVFTADSAVIYAGAGYLKIVTLGMLFSVPMTVYTAAFNGAGDTMPPMLIAFMANWVGKIGIAYMATYILGYSVNFIWIAISVSMAIEGIGVAFWFKRGKWKLKKV